MKQSILITGGTKGIGRACVERFLREGWAVTVVSRTGEDLAAMKAESDVTTIQADLSTEAGVTSVPIADYDALLLNAAAYQPGPLLDAKDNFAEMYQLNVLGNHRLARRLAPAMVLRNRGHLIAIGSTGTDNWKPHMTAYVATKYALRGLFLGWQAELARTQVRCTLVAPGATLTSSWDNEIPPGDILQPETVAEVVWQAVSEGREGRVTV